MFNETYNLSNGATIPKLGLGTWLLDYEQAEQAVRDAVSIGYRHIDTAQAYMNEAGVGKGIRSCGVAREELFITTKVAAEAKNYDAVTQSIDESLAKMGLDYVDLLIIHSLGMSSVRRTVISKKTKRYGEPWRMHIKQAK
jgi:diketogulonate reductase-like aldo/keto reductase